jgi:hypothetical protein
MNPTELTVFVTLLALMALVAFVVCDDDQWPHV